MKRFTIGLIIAAVAMLSTLVVPTISNAATSYIMIEKKGHSERFDFIIDSHYMQKQLEKLAAEWNVGKSTVEML